MMAKTIMHVSGIDGQVELTSDRVIVHRKGLLNALKHGANARHEIPLASISGVDFRDATLFKQGMIDFDYPGKNNSGVAHKNAVIFGKKQQQGFYDLKEKIFQIIETSRRQSRT